MIDDNLFSSRTSLLIGQTGLNLLEKSHVLICGVGGVGSYAAEALGRTGVGTITLVDGDVICPTNINRQIHALYSTVGCIKVTVMAARLRDINPGVQVNPIYDFLTDENVDELLHERPDYVVDAIDNFTAKVSLISACREWGIPIISSMGAANKLDPTKIHVDDISATRNCRMARSMRKILRLKGISSGVRVVYSVEEHRGLTLNSMPENNITGSHPQVTLGSISFIPGIFGLMMAGTVINDLLVATD